MSHKCTHMSRPFCSRNSISNKSWRPSGPSFLPPNPRFDTRNYDVTSTSIVASNRYTLSRYNCTDNVPRDEWKSSSPRGDTAAAVPSPCRHGGSRKVDPFMTSRVELFTVSSKTPQWPSYRSWAAIAKWHFHQRSLRGAHLYVTSWFI